MIQTVIFWHGWCNCDTEPVHRYAYFQQFAELIFVEEMFTSFTGELNAYVFQNLNAF
jgi:hypothetical protein